MRHTIPQKLLLEMDQEVRASRRALEPDIGSDARYLAGLLRSGNGQIVQRLAALGDPVAQQVTPEKSVVDYIASSKDGEFGAMIADMIVNQYRDFLRASNVAWGDPFYFDGIDDGEGDVHASEYNIDQVEALLSYFNRYIAGIDNGDLRYFNELADDVETESGVYGGLFNVNHYNSHADKMFARAVEALESASIIRGQIASNDVTSFRSKAISMALNKMLHGMSKVGISQSKIFKPIIDQLRSNLK